MKTFVCTFLEYDEGDEEDVEVDSETNNKDRDRDRDSDRERHDYDEEEDREEDPDIQRYPCEDENPCDHDCWMIQHRYVPEPRIECTCRSGFVLDENDGRTCLGE